MRKHYLTYAFLIILCISGTGCAGTMKSHKVNTGPQVANLGQPSVNLEPQNNYLPGTTVETLTVFINDYNKRLSYADAKQIADSILKTSINYGVDYKVVTALVAIESSFRPDAVSPSGARGLGQLMPATARSLNVSDPFDPLDNLNGAVKLLRENLERFNGDVNFALAAYKMGSGAVSRNGISQSSTVRYIENIRKIFDNVP